MQLVENGAPVLLKEAFDHFRITRIESWGSDMRLVVSRLCPFIDSNSLELRNGREALFRQQEGGFILYLSDSDKIASAEERIVRLDARSALLWVNEQPENRGSFWQ
jgi:hypothetical protein